MRILGIETSCDETSVALVEDGRRVIANLIYSQVQMHAEFGGVVPELASRAHIQKLLPMIQECLGQTGLRLLDVGALAVTRGPGLVGALLVGVEMAKAMAFALNKPLIPVHHIAAHLYSPFLYSSDAGDAPPPLPLHFPYIGLVVSGGHTSLVKVQSPVDCELLGETVDDAAGEAFDKIAKLLELPYPGGPEVDRRARQGDPTRFALPRPMLRDGFNFSFSGLKTAVLHLVRELGADAVKQDEQTLNDVCASFQEAVVDVLVTKSVIALEATGCRHLAVVGGVASNHRLRQAMQARLAGTPAVFPPPMFCTDNAAMIAGLAYHLRQQHPRCNLALDADANLPLTPQ